MTQEALIAPDSIHGVVEGHEIRLKASPSVFRPTSTTWLLIKHAMSSMLPNQIILDLGCGSGPIAIALATNGAKRVYAIDLMPEACELAVKNAELNEVSERITVLRGDLFAPVEGLKFDVIVDDVSGVAEEVARLSSWFPPKVPTGGEDGTDLTVRMLNEALRYLNPGGHLIFPVLSLSRSSKITGAARGVFGDGLVRVASKVIPFNHELRDNLSALARLRESGVISYDQIRSRYFWTLDIYRASATS